jgi:hypothetical protein
LKGNKDDSGGMRNHQQVVKQSTRLSFMKTVATAALPVNIQHFPWRSIQQAFSFSAESFSLSVVARILSRSPDAVANSLELKPERFAMKLSDRNFSRIKVFKREKYQ